jgi:NAD(P)-dependent dehydrogenase (short-subunit alcohol dehydrogenase family)
MATSFDLNLAGTVAVVTGASRGAGRAIALVLGETGATVYVSGRSTHASPSAAGREGTIEETAEAVEGRGGIGIPVHCDHTLEHEVERLIERVGREQGKLDLLVNNAWGGYERHSESDPPFFDAEFWEQPLWQWDGMFTAGVRAHFLASRCAATLMISQRRRAGLIVHTIAWAFGSFLGNVLYDTAKAATARLAYGTAQQLRPHRVAAVALAPGHLGVTESPEYLGRAVAALAADSDILTKTGGLLTVGELAREYGFTDIDGTQPVPWGLPNRS